MSAAARAERTPFKGPRYLQIADDLRLQIEEGALAAGDELPSLATLSRRYGVSQGVSRQAIALLRQQALITSGQGRRPRVRERRTRIAASNRKHSVEKSAVQLSEDERRTTGALEYSTGQSLEAARFEVDYLRIINNSHTRAFPDGVALLHREYETLDEHGQRLLWSESFLPLDLIESNPELLDPENEPWPGGTQHQLSTVGIEIAEVRDIVTARAASSVETERWGMAPGDPMIIVDGLLIDTEGRAVCAGLTAYPSDRSSLEYVTTLT